MDFDRSTQAKSWLFDEHSIAACRERAVVEVAAVGKESGLVKRTKKVRKYASGFHSSYSLESHEKVPQTVPTVLSPEEQESLVQFHAHQMQTLVGPTALLRELRTSVAVLSTAVSFFRRFYLSNSVIAINPRKMAAACCFFAAKVEEEKVEVSRHCRSERTADEFGRVKQNFVSSEAPM